MKTLFYFSSLFLLLNSCKEPKKEIEYPASSSNGQNLLRLNNIDSLNTTLEYTLATELEKDAHLEVIFENLSDNSNVTSSEHFAVWLFSINSSKWEYTTYNDDNGQQKFSTNGGGSYDLNITFKGEGMGKIYIYENYSTSPSYTKSIFWE